MAYNYKVAIDHCKKRRWLAQADTNRSLKCGKPDANFFGMGERGWFQ
jgi:hypothetical protein